MSEPSGRGFLQTFGTQSEMCPERSHFFETLKSKRRLNFVSELNERIVATGSAQLPDRLACFPCLDGFDVYATDGHFHEHACHDQRKGGGKSATKGKSGTPTASSVEGPETEDKGTFYAVAHLYTRNLRSGLVAHLINADEVTRKKEHEMRALKRLSITAMRQNAPKGRKVIHVYDRAGIDFAQWFKWKHGSGIYLISRTKTNMVLEVCGQLPFARDEGVNAGVLADELVSPSYGEMLRRVTFHDVHSGRTFEYLTNLIDSNIPPGVIAQLYKMRWDIEKSFDEMKNKLMEQKAWATSATAKEMQAQFICMTLNLVSLLAHTLEVEEGITNIAESRRKQSRTEEAIAREIDAGLAGPSPWQMVQNFTQHSVKLYRWIAARMWSTNLWSLACEALRRLYDQL
jgi:hypothetical protein